MQVNDSYRGTLSSYCYVLMCIHLLQQRQPVILPCLQSLKPATFQRWAILLKIGLARSRQQQQTSCQPCCLSLLLPCPGMLGITDLRLACVASVVLLMTGLLMCQY